MTTTRPAAAQRVPIYDESSGLMLFADSTSLPVYNNVAFTNDYICIRFPYAERSQTGVLASAFYGINFGAYADGAINFNYAQPTFPDKWWDGSSMSLIRDDFPHLFKQWQGVHALDRGMFRPIERGFPKYLEYDFFMDNGGFIAIPLNYFVGYGYDSIYCKAGLLWWYDHDPADPPTPDTSDPSFSYYAYAWRSSSDSNSQTMPGTAVSKLINLPWLPLSDYTSSVPGSETNAFIVSWDNETDTISIS